MLTLTPAALFYLTRQQRVNEYVSAWMVTLWHMLLTPSVYLSWLKLVQGLLNPIALLTALLGLFLARGRNLALLLGLWVGYLIYGLFFPYQIETHYYYHLQLIPIVTLSMVPAVQFFTRRLVKLGTIWQVAFAAGVLIVVAYAAWLAILPAYRSDYRDEPRRWQAIAAQIPNDGKTIAVIQDFGFRLIYYGWRKVEPWPNVNQIDVRNMRGKTKSFAEYFARQTQGEKYFLVTDFEEFAQQPELQKFLAEHYSIFQQGDDYILFDLSQPE